MAKVQNHKKNQRRPRENEEREFEQRIVDLARVTRVMAGGKRMRFRACVALGDQKGRVGVGMAKGTDVTIAISKAVNRAKKKMILVPIVYETIPHKIYHKFGAAKILLKPAPVGTGVKSGGAVRIILELAGIPNVVSKILGTNSKINNAQATIEALSKLKKIKVPEAKQAVKLLPEVKNREKDDKNFTKEIISNS